MERTLTCGCLLTDQPRLSIRYCAMHRATDQVLWLLRGLRHMGETGHKFGSHPDCVACMDTALSLSKAAEGARLGPGEWQ